MKLTFRYFCASQVLLLSMALLSGCSSEPSDYGFRKLHKLSHDQKAYTQGLLIHEGALYESTGLAGQSTLRKLNLTTGAIERQIYLPQADFGEGLAVFEDKLFQLTWQNRKVYVYDLKSLAKMQEFGCEQEGWGLTCDGKLLVMSDGSDSLYWRDPKDFKIVKTLRVKDGKRSVDQLNELEFVEGEIWANIYHSKRVARISPQSGKVLGWIDFTGLPLPEDYYGGEDVLNGIARDPSSGKIYVTGKLYRSIYEVEIFKK